MTNDNDQSRSHLRMSEFWSTHLGLTLVTISLAILIFVVTPLREAGLPGRFFFDLVVVALMIFGALAVNQSSMDKAFVIVVVVISATVLGIGRVHPTLFLRLAGSILATVTLLLYVRIVLLVMFRKGPVNWSRIQGGLCAYLLLAWPGLQPFSSWNNCTQAHSTSLPRRRISTNSRRNLRISVSPR